MKLAYVWLFALALSGCATSAEREDGRIQTAITATVAAVDRCGQQVEATPAWNAIGRRFDHSKTPLSLQEMADRAYATPSEIAQIFALHDASQPCRKLRMEGFGEYLASAGGILAERYAQQDGHLLRLVRRQATWGEFRSLEQQSQQQFATRVTSALDAIKRRLAASHDAEMERRANAAAFFQQWSFQQQMLNEMRRTRVTNCQYIGSLMSCTTS